MRTIEMAPWALLKVRHIPALLGIVFSLGLSTCFIVAVLRKDVSPYVPFISETGAQYPEAGIFSIFLYLTSALSLFTMFVRYLVVDEMNKKEYRTIDILNVLSIISGVIAIMGMVVVASYPMTSVVEAHNTGADILFICANIYAFIQTCLTYRMRPEFNGTLIFCVRLVITIVSITALIVMLVIAPLAFDQWGKGRHDHWTGDKVPNDSGFYLMLGSAICEWTMALCFTAYYYTFIREFAKVSLSINVNVLVPHFDDDMEDFETVIANERSPIVLS